MKFHLKSFISGAIVATLGVATVFAAGGIKSAVFNANKIVFDGEKIDLSRQPMISVVKEGESSASNYMPVRGVLEAMGYEVTWDGSSKTVHVNTRGSAAPEIALTADTLSGTWVNSQDGDNTVFQFDKNGNIKWLLYNDNNESYSSGKYEIAGDTIIAKYDYLNMDGVIDQFTGSDIMEVYMELELKGSTLSWVGENYPMTLTRATKSFDFSRYISTLTADALNGSWVGSQDGVTTTLSFDKNGNIKWLWVDDTFESYSSGKYVMTGNAVSATFDYAYMNGKASKLTGGDKVKMSMTMTVNDDKLTWVNEKNPLTLIKAAKDVDFEKYTATGLAPMDDRIIGYWTCTDESVTVKYYFDRAGNVYTLGNIEGEGSTFMSGRYAMAGDDISVVFTYANTDGERQNLTDDDIMRNELTIEFSRDGNSWTASAMEPDTFVRDTGSKDWVNYER